MIPDAGSEEELKQALLAMPWLLCTACGSLNLPQAGYGPNESLRDEWDGMCQKCGFACTSLWWQMAAYKDSHGGRVNILDALSVFTGREP